MVRAAEEAASTLASSIHPEQCIKVLCPIVQTADYPINLAAIKMQTRAIERIAKEPLHQLLSDIIPGLLQVSFSTQDSSQSSSPLLLHSASSAVAGLRQHREQREEGQRLLPGGHLLRDWRGAEALPGSADRQQGTLISCHSAANFSPGRN